MPTTPRHKYRNQRHTQQQRTKSSTTKLPQDLQKQLEAQEDDERTFETRFKNRAQSRKDMRKKQRMDKKRHRVPVPKNLQPEYQPPNKRQKTGPASKTINSVVSSPKKPDITQKPFTTKGLATENREVSDRALEKLSASNPKFFSLLQTSNLVSSNVTGAGLSDKAFDDDNRDIAEWEKKLGMKKKKSKELGKTWEDEGLADLLDGLDDINVGKKNNKSDKKTVKHNTKAKTGDTVEDVGVGKKRRREPEAMELDGDEKEGSEEELDSGMDDEESYDDLLDSLEDGEDEDDDEDDNDDEDDDEDENDDMDGFDSGEELGGIEEKDEDALHGREWDAAEHENEEKEQGKDGKDDGRSRPSMISAGRYVPPHLRVAATTKSEQQIRLQRQLQGLLNKLSESNLESILIDVEKCYQLYPRHDVTSTITTIILTTISQKANLLDSFVILYAVVIASLYRLVGVEFAAHFTQTLIESFEQYFRSLTVSSHTGGDDDLSGGKEAKNLITLVAELYNFQVISCVLVYDLVRLLIEKLDEPSVELLLRVMRASGARLRQDDPTALKDIIQNIQAETAKRDPKSLGSRHKFMLETITNLKNNKVKPVAAAASQGDKETLLRMKKFLGNLGKKRAMHSTEALRVSLEDIRNVEIKGKWWLVGSSWRDNMVGTESKHSMSAIEAAKDSSVTEALIKLARQQGMNTDVRRSVFVVLMSSEDYVDAYERLMKLSLTEVQEREIARVILHCVGNEKIHNPYYGLIANRLCGHNHSFKITFQYCLWDFLREMGETDVGGLEKVKSLESLRVADSPVVPLRRTVNLAKFYAWLVSENALSLVILKSVNFTALRPSSRLFFQLFFGHVIMNSQTRAQVAGRRNAQAVADVFLKVASIPTLAQGVLFFLHHFVRKGKFLSEGPEKDKEKELVVWGCGIVKESVQGAINTVRI